jgi:hypothetical protein
MFGTANDGRLPAILCVALLASGDLLFKSRKIRQAPLGRRNRGRPTNWIASWL